MCRSLTSKPWVAVLSLLLLLFNSLAMSLDFNNCTGTLRVCFEGEDPMKDGRRVCWRNKLGSAQTVLDTMNWDGAVYSNWFAQIILSEQGQIPSRINDISSNGKADYYKNYARPNEDIVYGHAYSYEALKAGGADEKNPDCLNVQSDCAHVLMENWTVPSRVLGLFPWLLNGGINGIFGRLGWYVTEYTTQVDSGVLDGSGMADGAKMQQLFERPLTPSEVCKGLGGMGMPDDVKAFCGVFVAAGFVCSGEAPHALCNAYLVTGDQLKKSLTDAKKSIDVTSLPLWKNTYVFVSPFTATHTNPQNAPRGYMASPPCDWNNLDRYLSATNAKGIWPVIQESAGMLMDFWDAAVIRKKGAIFYWWTPEPIFARKSFEGPEYGLKRVSFPEWSSACEKTRPTIPQQCEAFKDPMYVYNQTNCDYKVVPVWKAFSKVFGTDPKYSAASKILSRYYVEKDVQEDILARLKYDKELQKQYPNQPALVRKHIACEWMKNNRDTWQDWLPSELKALRCLRECNGNGECKPSVDGNPIGDCHCKSGFTGAACDRYVPDNAFATSATVIAAIGVAHASIYIPCVIMTRHTALMLASTPSFMLVILFGAILGNGGVIGKLFEIRQMIPCGLSDCIMTFAYSLVVGPLIIKGYRVVKLFEDMKKTFISIRMISLILGLSLLLDGIIFIAWFIKDPPKYIDTEYVKGANIRQCKSQNDFWPYLILIPKVVMLLKAIDIAYNMRNINSAFNESKVIALIIYNVSLVVAIGVPIASFTPDITTSMIVYIFCYLWGLNFPVGALMISKIFHIINYGQDSIGARSEDGGTPMSMSKAMSKAGGGKNPSVANAVGELDALRFTVEDLNNKLVKSEEENKKMQNKLKVEEINRERRARGEAELSEADAALMNLKHRQEEREAKIASMGAVGERVNSNSGSRRGSRIKPSGEAAGPEDKSK